MTVHDLLSGLRSALGAGTGWSLAAALLTSVALLLCWPSPSPAALPAADRAGPTVPRWLGGRDDAAPLVRRLGYGAALGVALGSVLRGLGPSVAVVIAAGAALGAAVALGRLEPRSVRADRRRRIAGAPQALDLLASCLAAGLPVRAALRAVTDVVDGPLGDDLSQVLRLTELGHDDVSAWRTLAGHAQLGPAALDLARSVETGSLLVESLLVHAEVAREERCGQVEAAARRVGVRSVMPLMVCFIPAFLLIGIVPTVASAVMRALHF
jgi:pilus assembly protein TadC